MKLLERIQGLKIWAMLLLAGGAFASCNVLSEEEMDCAVYVSFKYDYNMKFADAFANSVKSVTLYAFGKDGKLAFQKTEEGSILSQEGYAMKLDEINRNEADEYDFITWAGLANNGSFTVPLLQVGSSTKEDLYCQLERAEGGIVNENLQSLFHGRSVGSSVSRTAASNGNVEISLTKNTNNIRIILQHISGAPVDVDKLHFTITDKNGLMNYDNTLSDDEVITYKAWRKEAGHAGMGEQVEVIDGITEINVAIAELTVSRLVVENEPILTITNDLGERIVTIPLIDTALLSKRFENSSMADQEYLDRQDEYNMTFFLDDGDKWMDAYIYINSWKVVLSNHDL